MLLGALNLTPIEVAQAFQTIASGGNRAPLSALRSVIAEDGKVLYQSFPQAERAVPAQAAYLTLWTMQQVVQRGTGRQLGAKYPNLHLAGKTGTTNNNVDTWFAGIDGSTVTITWVGRDNNQPTKLYGASGAMSIYQRYLANQTPTPLNLVPPEDIADMGVDYDGNFVCSGGMRVLRSGPAIRNRCASRVRCSSNRQAIRLISLLSRSNSNLLNRSKKTATAWLAGSRRCLVVINIVIALRLCGERNEII